MSDAIRCDQCHYSEQSAGSIGWLHTEYRQIDVRNFGDALTDCDFCSVACLVEYFTTRQTSLAKEPRGVLA